MSKSFTLSKLSFFTIFASYVLNSAASLLVVTAAPYMRSDLEITILASSLLLSAFPLGSCLGQLYFGTKISYYGVHRVYLCGTLVLFFSCLASYLFANNIYLLTLLYFFQAVGVAAIILAARCILSRVARGDTARLGKYYSLEYFATVASGAAAPLVATLLIIYTSWSAIYLLTALLAAIFTLLFWCTVYRYPIFEKATRKTSSIGFSTILQNTSFVYFTLIGVATYIWLYIYLVGVPFALVSIFGTSPGVYGAIMSSCLVASLLGAMSNLLLLTRWTIKTVLAGSIVVTAATASAMWIAAWFNFAPFPCFIITVLILSFSVTLAMTEAMTLAINSCPATHTALAAALFGFLVYAAGFLTSALTGLVLGLPYDDLLSLISLLAGTTLLALPLTYLAFRRSSQK